MTVLYLTRRRSVLRKRAGSLIVTLDEDPDGRGPLPEHREELIEVEPHRIEAVVIVGDSHVTSDALRLCFKHGINITWLGWNGKPQGKTVAAESRSADLRLLQYAEYSNPETRIRRAAQVVESKLVNARGVLDEIRKNHPDNAELKSASIELSQSVDTIRDEEFRKTMQPENLLGKEGNGAKIYFRALGTAFRGDIRFTERRKHPSPDPANALLSFGYVLLASRIESAITARGLDPILGFYHELRPGRPSLALDLLEEFRHPIVDRFVLRICNLNMFSPDDFLEHETGGVRLERGAQKKFFREWEKFLTRPVREKDAEKRLTVPKLIERQVDRFASSLRNEAEYKSIQYGR